MVPLRAAIALACLAAGAVSVTSAAEEQDDQAGTDSEASDDGTGRTPKLEPHRQAREARESLGELSSVLRRVARIARHAATREQRAPAAEEQGRRPWSRLRSRDRMRSRNKAQHNASGGNGHALGTYSADDDDPKTESPKDAEEAAADELVKESDENLERIEDGEKELAEGVASDDSKTIADAFDIPWEGDEDYGKEEGADEEKKPANKIVTKTLRIATWNALSVSKTSNSADKLPGMTIEAVERHNGLVCPGGTQKKADESKEKEKDQAEERRLKAMQRAEDEKMGTFTPPSEEDEELEPFNALVRCYNQFFQSEVFKLFNTSQIDVMVVQEVDWQMLQGFKALTTKYRHMPIGGFDAKMMGRSDGAEYRVESWLRIEKEFETPAEPGGDYTFVLWDTEKIEKVMCHKLGADIPIPDTTEVQSMRQIGVCRFIVTDDESGEPFDFQIVGMHADGAMGFTKAQGNQIARGTKRVDAVLGDLQVTDRAKILEALSPIPLNATFPDEPPGEDGEEGVKTVFRTVHPYAKLLEAIQETKASNTIRRLHDKDGDQKAKVVKATCNELADEKVENIETNDQLTDYEKEDITELKKERIEARGKIFFICEAVKEAKKKLYEEPADSPKLMPKVEALMELFLQMAEDRPKLWAAVSDHGFDFNDISGDFGITETWAIKDKTWLKDYVAREDWAIYDGCRFVSGRVTVPYLDTLRDAKNSMQGMPVEAFPSDHLPLIMELEYEFPFPKQKYNNCKRKVARKANQAKSDEGIKEFVTKWYDRLKKIDWKKEAYKAFKIVKTIATTLPLR